MDALALPNMLSEEPIIEESGVAGCICAMRT
ncbi:hypothetical protein AK812_SmicGene47140, partial [Symbiodinium microadriaticum]